MNVNTSLTLAFWLESGCIEQSKKEEGPTPESGDISETGTGGVLPTDQRGIGEAEGGYVGKTMEKVKVSFTVPKGKVSGIMGVMNLLQSRFDTLKIKLTAKDGEIPEQEYEDKIKETFRQLEIELEDED